MPSIRKTQSVYPKKWANTLIALVIIETVGGLPLLSLNGRGVLTGLAQESPANKVEAAGTSLVTFQANTLVPVPNPPTPAYLKTKKVRVIVTAYSSTPDQTDNDPFVTASGVVVHDGIVANNLLPFGTQVRMPEIYGDEIFTVEDRANPKNGLYHVDIWFPSYWEARDFGVRRTYIEVLES